MVSSYDRISTREQALAGYNLEGNRIELERYCKNKYPNEKMKRYVDEGVSGRSLERKNIKNLISDIKYGKISSVVIKKLDRLTRSIEDWLFLEKMFLEYKIEFVSLNENIDLTSSSGRFQARLSILLADFEETQLSERTIQGMKNGLLQGNYSAGKAPFGFRNNKETKRLDVIPEEKQIYLDIVNMVFNNRTKVDIEMIINSRPYMIANNKKINAKTLYKIVRNKIYCGVVVFAGEEYLDLVEPFITTEKWLALQEKYHYKTVKTKHKYMFHGLVKCSCGKYMISVSAYGRHGVVYLYYKCNSCNYTISETNLSNSAVPYMMRHIKTTKSQINKKKFKSGQQEINNRLQLLYNDFVNDEISLLYFRETSLLLINKRSALIKEHKRLQKNLSLNFNILPIEDREELINKNIREIVIDNNIMEVHSIYFYEK